jgi:hypothetical protein
MNWQQWFYHNGHEHPAVPLTTYEDVFQAFKARMIAEINEVTIANIDSTSFSGSITLEEEYD